MFPLLIYRDYYTIFKICKLYFYHIFVISIKQLNKKNKNKYICYIWILNINKTKFIENIYY